ncbi:MAG: HD domain-containing protein [Ruminococcus sp.]|nr:HD domain-containing protein [Ruminococcus sp.]
MKIISSIKDWWKNKSGKGAAFPLIGVAVIVFVLTVAVYFVAAYIADSYSRDNMLSGWGYAYTDRAGAVPSGELRIFNAQNPVITEKSVYKHNLYFTKTIHPDDAEKTFVMITDYSPVKIRVNGKEVYNNHFDSADYVGNCYNAIWLEPSTHDRELEVFMKLPYSVRFETYLTDGNPAFQPNAGMVIGLGLFAAGFAALLTLTVLSIVKRKPRRSLVVAGIVTYTGVAVTMHILPEVTYWLNNPIWLRILAIPAQLSFLVALACLSSRFKVKGKTMIALGFATGISIVSVMLSFTPLMVKLSLALMSILCLAAALFTTQTAYAQMERRIQYASPVFVMCVYLFMTILFAGILMFNRQRVLYIYSVTFPVLVVAGMLEYICVADYRYHQKNLALQAQTTLYGNTVEKISRFIRNMMQCADREHFFETAAEETKTLLVSFNSANEAVICAAAAKENGVFHEYFHQGTGACNYELIAANSDRSGKNCLLYETYFDFILRDNEKAGAVLHFENVSNGLDMFFGSMLETIYCGLEMTYENTFRQGSGKSLNVMFTELAENAEIDNGYTPDHLEHVYQYTKALCRKTGMSNDEAEKVALAAKLHDLGKLAVPKYIINKQGRFNEEERVIINSHTQFGYTILSAFSEDAMISVAANIALYHHERYDGNGVNGLEGEDIPLEARIVTICDVFDALTTERTYKAAWSKEEAVNYLTNQKGKIFDPQLTDLFIGEITAEGD